MTDSNSVVLEKRGPAFWIWTAVAYLYLAIGNAVLVRLIYEISSSC